MRAATGVVAGVLFLAGCGGGDGGGVADVPTDGSAADGIVTDDGSDRGGSGTDLAKDFVPGPDKDSIPLYDESTIVQFHLTFAPAEWARFTDCWKNPTDAILAQTQKCPFVHCGFAFGDTTFPDAACRPKGNPNSWNVEVKPQFLVRFNEWNPDGRFLGMRRINLEFNSDHGAPVRDRLALGLMRDVGIDAPRANSARLWVDGTPYGLYQNIEPLDREFLEDHFADPTGNLYDEFDEQKTNEEVPATARLDELNERIEGEALGGDHAAFIAAMQGLVDIDVVLRILAVEILLPTTDNFKDGGGNFYWYDQPGRGFVMLPWDLDDCLWTLYSPPDQDPMSCQASPEFTDTPSPLCQLIHDIPGWDGPVFDRVVEWRDTKYAELEDRARSMCDQLRPYAGEGLDGLELESALERFENDCAALPPQVPARIAFLKTALGR